jgi:putative ABC transport system substrate-binding protein
VKRREFITFLGVAAAWPLAAGAQQPVVPVIGYLGLSGNSGLVTAFRDGLAEAGYVAGQSKRRPNTQPIS